MIEKNEIITCKSYHGLCDYHYDYPNLDDIPPTGVVHVPLDQIEEFFRRIDSNGHTYVVVSSCSDFGLAIQAEDPAWKDMLKWLGMQIGPTLGYSGVKMPVRVEEKKCKINDTYSIKCHSWTRATLPSIPTNVHHWFVSNLMFFPDTSVYEFLQEDERYKKFTAIPFGIAEGKTDEIYEAMKESGGTKSRDDKIYVSWNDYTLERYELRKGLMDWQSYVEADLLTVNLPGDGQDSYEDYLSNLSKHKYVISPPGNGADCYRTLESIYMGCFTFVENTPCNSMTKLPVFKYNNLDDIIGCYNGKHEMVDGFEERSEIKLSHWKRLIDSKRGEIL